MHANLSDMVFKKEGALSLQQLEEITCGSDESVSSDISDSSSSCGNSDNEIGSGLLVFWALSIIRYS
jgi:hypothetical protein